MLVDTVSSDRLDRLPVISILVEEPPSVRLSSRSSSERSFRPSDAGFEG